MSTYLSPRQLQRLNALVDTRAFAFVRQHYQVRARLCAEPERPDGVLTLMHALARRRQVVMDLDWVHRRSITEPFAGPECLQDALQSRSFDFGTKVTADASPQKGPEGGAPQSAPVTRPRVAPPGATGGSTRIADWRSRSARPHI